ncbi:MAG: hypothetical protein FJX78_00530 [Armatimonadetes bacterium]|nr:hypothetical protein [Armatimonadota bacterium]
MKDAQAAMKEMMTIEAEVGFEGARVLTDLVDDYYTLVLESEFPSLVEFEKAFQQEMTHRAGGRRTRSVGRPSKAAAANR